MEVAGIKERPILFSPAMVQAILAGRKTQTRRVVKPQPKNSSRVAHIELMPPKSDGTFEELWWDRIGSSDGKLPRCPYGHPGDRLWVRETFGISYSDGYKIDPCVCYRFGHVTVNQYPIDPKVIPADYKHRDGWRPSIFMPRWASRINLEITNVRVERVQDISEEDALAEGIPVQMGDGTGSGPGYKWNGPGYWDTVNKGMFGPSFHVERNGSCCCNYGREHKINPAVCAYRFLWDSINSKRGFGWGKDPWTWVIEFNFL